MGFSPTKQLERCVELCMERAWQVAFGLLRDRDEAYDAVQQAFVVAARKPRRIPTGDPWPWFAVVVAHEARNLRRKMRPTPASTLTGRSGLDMERRDPLQRDPSQAAEDAETHARIWEAVNSLPPDERDAVVLTQVSGMSHARTAKALGVPRATVSLRIRRGLDRIRAYLRRRNDDSLPLPETLAALPLVPPPGGWETAASAWKQSAVGALSAGATSATSAVTGSVGIMTQKTLVVVATVTACLVAGFFAGDQFGPSSSQRPAISDTSQRDRDRDALDLQDPRVLDSIPRATLEQLPVVQRLKNKVGELEAKFTESDRQRQELDQQLAALSSEQAPKGPVFTFGVGGQLPGVREADWVGLATASNVVQDAMIEILELQEAGETPPKGLLIQVQKNIERMRIYEYQTLEKLPTAAKHNGELTHPISLTNLIAAILEDGGQPLSEQQIERIAKLGMSFEDTFATLRDRYPATTPRVKRLLDEYLLKGTFTEDLERILTPKQREIAIDERTHRIASLDLLCPTLLIIHTSPLLTGSNVEEVKQKLESMLAQKFQWNESQSEAAAPYIAKWVERIQPISEPVRSSRARHYSYEEGALAAEATVELYEDLLRYLELDGEIVDRLLDDYAIYIPRILAPAADS